MYCFDKYFELIAEKQIIEEKAIEMHEHVSKSDQNLSKGCQENVEKP